MAEPLASPEDLFFSSPRGRTSTTLLDATPEETAAINTVIRLYWPAAAALPLDFPLQESQHALFMLMAIRFHASPPDPAVYAALLDRAQAADRARLARRREQAEAAEAYNLTGDKQSKAAATADFLSSLNLGDLKL